MVMQQLQLIHPLGMKSSNRFHCLQYCQNIFSRNELTLDHVIPKSKNGPTNWENVVTSCKSCNSAKGSTLQKPIREPFKPSFSHLLNGHKIDENTFPDSEWAKYIF